MIRALILTVTFGTLTLALIADDPKQAELAKKPQYERLLKGEDAKKEEELNKKIDAAEATGSQDEAIKLQEEVIALRTRVQGADHWEVINQQVSLKTLRSLDADGRRQQQIAVQANREGVQLNAKGRYAEAQTLLQKALEIRRRVLGEDHPATATSLNNVAYNFADQGKAAEAQTLLQKALEIRRRVLGEDHPDTAASYNNMAMNLNTQGKAAEAQTLLQKALEIRRRVLGEDHPDTATSYINVASNLAAQGKAAEAQPLYQKASEIFRKVLGEDHPHTAISYNSVASNLEAQGKAAEAQPLYQKASEIFRKVLGEDHPHTAISYNSVAYNLNAQGKATEAQPLFQKALEIRRRVLGEDHTDTACSYNSVAYNLNAQGKATEAQPLFQKALEIRRRVLGEDHTDTAMSYNNLAAHLAAQGKASEAQPLVQKALEITRKVLGEDHPTTANSYNNVAFNLADQGKVAEALPFLRQAIFSHEASRLNRAQGIERAIGEGVNPRLLLAAIEQAKSPLEAWSQVELSLSRGLLDQQGQSNALLSPQEIAELTPLQDRVQELQSLILVLVRKPKKTVDENTKLNRLVQDRREANEKLAQLVVAASTRAVASREQIQAAIPTASALLLWVDVSDTSGQVQEHFACVVRREGEPYWISLPGTGEQGKWTKEDSLLPGRLRAELSPAAPSQPMIESLAKKLHAQRIAPVLKHLEGVKTLYVVGVNEMAGIPVSLLTDQFTISYVPSGTFLAQLRDQPKLTSTQFLALGDAIYETEKAKIKTSTDLPPGGILITQVIPMSAADKAGLQVGDVILKYGEAEIAKLEDLQKASASTKAEKVSLTIWREGEAKPFPVEIAAGRMGVVLDREPAPVAIANKRKTEAMLASIRGGNWTDLPGTRVETNRIKELFGENAKIYTDSNASEQTLESLRKSGELSKYRYLHFATHGEGNNVKAFESSLILSQDNLPKELMPKAGEPFLNGQLSAREVLDYWKLNAELVTLSACETAIGKSGGGDGLLGFAQAFLTAGARSVCLSLWKVDDTATALLMSRFYENLLGKREGLTKPMGKAAALDEAKRWLRSLSQEEALKLTAAISGGVDRGSRGKGVKVAVIPKVEKDEKPFTHPKYWAAFVLIGDPD